MNKTAEIDLQNFETKVDEVMGILNMMMADNKTNQEEGLHKAEM